jgi:hypothetical protein
MNWRARGIVRRMRRRQDALTQAPLDAAVRDEWGRVWGLESILASAPGPTPGGIAGLTDTEFDAFLRASRG